MTDKEKAIRWFENIADECDKLTSGNVAHLSAQIKGMAIRSAEYLKKQEPASEDFESEWKRYCESKGGGAVTMNIKDVAKHFTQWQKEKDKKELQIAEEHGILTGMNMEREQLLKDAIEGEVETLYRHIVYVKSVGFDSSSIRENKQDVFAGDKVKVIIIKE
jgi:hypothetical protein